MVLERLISPNKEKIEKQEKQKAKVKSQSTKPYNRIQRLNVSRYTIEILEGHSKHFTS